ncbi:hypothetical protein PSP6_320148 [Paraburkholderia tropica]|nr:hypothetical protein PSP6_320148 [Paraburkholderia tropica]
MGAKRCAQASSHAHTRADRAEHDAPFHIASAAQFTQPKRDAAMSMRCHAAVIVAVRDRSTAIGPTSD